MRDLDECSGPWVGWWIQWGMRGHMRLSLQFSNGHIFGTGSDESGAFTVSGVYSGDSADLAKSYGTHVVHYDGRWNGASIAGPWHIDYVIYSPEGSYEFSDQGEFEMWPESESVSVEEILALADEAIERRDLVPIGEGSAGKRRR